MTNTTATTTDALLPERAEVTFNGERASILLPLDVTDEEYAAVGRWTQANGYTAPSSIEEARHNARVMGHTYPAGRFGFDVVTLAHLFVKR